MSGDGGACQCLLSRSPLRRNGQLASQVCDVGGAVCSQRRDEPAVGVVVTRDEVVGAPFEIDGGGGDRASDELKAQTELIGPEERGLGGMRGKAENAAGDRSCLC